MDSNTKRLLNALLLLSVLIFVLIMIPQFIGLSKSGFEEAGILDQFYFYTGSGIGFLFGIFVIFLVELYIKRGDEKYGNGIAFESPGEYPSIPYFKRFSNFQLFILSVIFFGTLGLFSYVTTQQTFTGVGYLEQQFTKTDSIIYSSALIPVSENAGAGFLLALMIMGLRLLSRKYNLEKQNFMIFSMMLFIVLGLYGLGMHLLRYGGQDVQLIIVFAFWSLGGLITLLTGSFIPFWIMHIANNFMKDMGRFFSNESLFIYVGLGLVAVTILYFILYRDKLLGGKVNEQAI